MKISAVIQARMSSQRLPGKVLLSLNGESVIGLQLRNLRCSSLIEQIIIATSIDPSDDPLAEYALKERIPLVRGPLNNVAERFLCAINDYQLEHVIRHCADRPFMDIRLIERGIELYKRSKVDIVTNAVQKRYPKGQTVEIFAANILSEHISRFETSDDLEHVMPFFYRHPEKFRIAHLYAPFDYSDVNLCLDTRSDLLIFERLLKSLNKPLSAYQWQELADQYRVVRDS